MSPFLLMYFHPFVLYRDSDCSAGTSLESYSGLLYASEMVQQDDFLTGLNRNGASSLQLNAQFNLQVHEQQSYPSDNFDLLNDGYTQPTEQMNTQENVLDFLLDRKSEVPQSGYDPLHHSWVSASSGTSGTAMFEEHLFPQASSYSCTLDLLRSCLRLPLIFPFLSIQILLIWMCAKQDSKFCLWMKHLRLIKLLLLYSNKQFFIFIFWFAGPLFI